MLFFMKIWHFLLFQIIICTVKACVCRTVTMTTHYLHDGPWTPAAFTARHQPTHSLQLSRHFLLRPDLDSVKLLPIHQLWTNITGYHWATSLSTIHIWLNLGLSIRLRSLFLYPSQIILHAAPQTECILCIYWDYSVHFRMNMCVCGVYVMLFEYSCVYSVSVLVSVQSVAWQLECKILMCKNISTQPQGFKCKGLCKWKSIYNCTNTRSHANHLISEATCKMDSHRKLSAVWFSVMSRL